MLFIKFYILIPLPPACTIPFIFYCVDLTYIVQKILYKKLIFIYDMKFKHYICFLPLHNYRDYLYQTFSLASPMHAYPCSHKDNGQDYPEHQSHSRGSCSF